MSASEVGSRPRRPFVRPFWVTYLLTLKHSMTVPIRSPKPGILLQLLFDPFGLRILSPPGPACFFFLGVESGTARDAYG